ncbi:hypothetical protein [Barrientosiimonas humi]|nr:hypothetical protein [Barrientosiimonas humi]
MDPSPIVTRAMEELATTTNLREEGWSYRQIGNHFGISAQAVFERLGRHS